MSIGPSVPANNSTTHGPQTSQVHWYWLVDDPNWFLRRKVKGLGNDDHNALQTSLLWYFYIKFDFNLWNKLLKIYRDECSSNHDHILVEWNFHKLITFSFRYSLYEHLLWLPCDCFIIDNAICFWGGFFVTFIHSDAQYRLIVSIFQCTHILNSALGLLKNNLNVIYLSKYPMYLFASVEIDQSVYSWNDMSRVTTKPT
jgi:hypothetical protein